MQLRKVNIERITPPSRESFVRDYISKRRPVILAGLAGDWPAISKWSAEYFRSTYGNLRVLAVPMKQGHVTESFKFRLGFVSDESYEEMDLAHFIGTLLSTDTKGYYLSTPVELFPSDFQKDFHSPPYCEGAPWVSSRVWFGREGTVGPLHRDLTDNLYTQVIGRKRFHLFPPSQSRYLYRYHPIPGFPNFSHVDAESPDLEKFPLLDKAEALVAELEPGDVLYFPKGFWHQTKSLSQNISLNFWWAHGLLATAALAVGKMRRALGMRFAK